MPLATQHAVHVEVLNRAEMSRDVIVLKMLRHFSELTFPAEAEEGFRFVDIEQALAVDAEGWTTVFKDYAAAGHGGFRKGRSG